MVKTAIMDSNVEAEQSLSQGNIRDGKRIVPWRVKSGKSPAGIYGFPLSDVCGSSISPHSLHIYV
jgi:hypothetical protein